MKRSLLVVAAAVTCSLLAAEAGRASAARVSFEVKKGGDVSWKSGACTADIWDMTRGGDGESVATGADVAGVELPAGRYEAVVGCPSDEGPVKRTVSFAMKTEDLTVPVALDPGFLLVTVLRFDTPVRAEITVIDDKGREVAASKEKAVIPLCAGRVRVLAKVDDPKASRPVFGNASATVSAKQKTNISVDTTDGELTVTLSDNGKKASGVAALRAPGQKTRLVELRAGEKGAVPPGTYDLVTQLDDTHDFSEVVTKNVVVVPGKAASRAVAHRTGTVKAVVLVDGKKPPEGAKIDVELGLPGAPSPFNTAAPNDTLKMAPGTFELVARRKDAPRDDGTEAVARQKVVVAGGGAKTVTLDLASATLDVTALLGGKPRAMDIEVVVPGGTAPVAKKTTGPEGKALFALSPGRYTVRGVLKSPQGDVVTQQNVSLALGSKMAMKLNLLVGTAVVQVFEGGVSVPAEVRFFDTEAMKDGKPTGEPVIAVPAGQEAIVPPGTYALVVVRKGNEKIFSDLKVAAGRTVERTVELKTP